MQINPFEDGETFCVVYQLNISIVIFGGIDQKAQNRQRLDNIKMLNFILNKINSETIGFLINVNIYYTIGQL